MWFLGKRGPIERVPKVIGDASKDYDALTCTSYSTDDSLNSTVCMFCRHYHSAYIILQ